MSGNSTPSPSESAGRDDREPTARDRPAAVGGTRARYLEAGASSPVLLRLPSGVEVLVRPVEVDDISELATSFARLSARSRYQRFFTAMPSLNAAQWAYLTQIDHSNHEALVALVPATGEIIGVARYIRSRTQRDSAELAVTIADEWQGRGVGKGLLNRLVERALEEGITRFTAEILSDNQAILALIGKVGDITTVADGSTTTATIAFRLR